jgi:hypothetical protein
MVKNSPNTPSDLTKQVVRHGQWAMTSEVTLNRTKLAISSSRHRRPEPGAIARDGPLSSRVFEVC